MCAGRLRRRWSVEITPRLRRCGRNSSRGRTKPDYLLAMGWRDWTAGSPKALTRPHVHVQALTELLLEGNDHVDAVGESHYQPALLRCCGARRGEEVSFGCRARLVPEPNNPYDSNAVAVQVDGEHV